MSSRTTVAKFGSRLVANMAMARMVPNQYMFTCGLAGSYSRKVARAATPKQMSQLSSLFPFKEVTETEGMGAP